MEDRDFADDVVLLASRYVDIQDKTDVMAEKAKGIGLDVNIDKTKVLRMNTRVTHPVQLYGMNIEDVEDLVYIGTLITSDGSSDAEVKARLALFVPSETFGEMGSSASIQSLEY